MMASQSSMKRTAPALIAEVDAAVRSVLGQQEPNIASGPASAGAAVFAERLLALRHAEAISSAAREVLVAPGTVVTPLARDRLKQRGIALRLGAKGDAARPTRTGDWAFAIERAAE